MEADSSCRQFVDSSITYVIPGTPIPLARPRFNGKVVWDCQKAVKDNISLYLRFQQKDKSLLEGPLHLSITFYMPIPKKFTRKMWHINRPDLDNMVKFYVDVAIGILYEDDKQIAKITACKVYDINARTEFSLTKLEE